jgi:hypothetical protein
MNQRVIADPSQHGWVEVDGKWVWNAESGGAGAGMVISETEPTDKVEGMQWLNPTTGLVLFWDDEKWLQMPTTGAAGKDGVDGVDGLWTDNGNNTISYSGTVLVSQPDAGANALSLGPDAGGVTQGAGSTALGERSGYTNQGNYAVAVGHLSGYDAQNDLAVAVGPNAGKDTQGVSAVALGHNAGEATQGAYALAVGANAGQTNQGASATAVGYVAGYENQSEHATALGRGAGYSGQGDFATAIGRDAAVYNQGSHSVAIGYAAGYQDQPANSVIISATGTAKNVANPNCVWIGGNDTKRLYYNGTDEWSFAGGILKVDGVPVTTSTTLIKTLSTLRKATMDETQDIRESLRSAIDELVAGFEQEITTMPAPEVSTQEIADE